ncbi:hypothetical protein BTW08_13855 [Salinicola sp. MH3R3-1]|nr:hypothetical protein BTW08_13855 [Salinicola sp. MH3R3-1]
MSWQPMAINDDGAYMDAARRYQERLGQTASLRWQRRIQSRPVALSCYRQRNAKLDDSHAAEA